MQMRRVFVDAGLHQEISQLAREYNIRYEILWVNGPDLKPCPMTSGAVEYALCNAFNHGVPVFDDSEKALHAIRASGLVPVARTTVPQLISLLVELENGRSY